MTAETSDVQSASAAVVTIPETVYDALLRLATSHRREVCKCENCPPDQAFQYDACECGDDWSSCEEDVATVEKWTPRPWGWRDGFPCG